MLAAYRPMGDVMSVLPRSALVIVFALVLQGPAQAAKRVALVLGNSAYAHAPPLPNPVNDANDVAAKLQALDFAVSLAVDATKASSACSGIVKSYSGRGSAGSGIDEFRRDRNRSTALRRECRSCC